MYDELVKKIRTLTAQDTRIGLEMQTQAADAIEELSKLNAEITKRELKLRMEKPRWIPVTERLPEKRKYVLVRYKNNDMAVACWFDGNEDILFWRAMTDEGWCADCDTDPTHWMPLPAPPEEES